MKRDQKKKMIKYYDLFLSFRYPIPIEVHEETTRVHEEIPPMTKINFYLLIKLKDYNLKRIHDMFCFVDLNMWVNVSVE